MLVLTVFILMRHWDEWEEKRTFKCDKYDIELCRIVLEIQMYSQRLFFGKYAEMYFDNSQRERLEKQVSSYKKRSDDIFNGLSETFTREEVEEKAGISVEAARMVICRWVKEGFCKKIVAKKGKGIWQKISQEQKQKS